jgi:hypothetical protein
MDDLIVFEAGMRSDTGKYSKFMESPDRQKVEDYLKIMTTTKPDGFELVLLEKHYQLVCTTPHIVDT